jgi:hypothetical protein
MFVFAQSQDVVVEDLQIQDSSAWTLNPQFSQRLSFRRLEITAPELGSHGHNTDGFGKHFPLSLSLSRLSCLSRSRNPPPPRARRAFSPLNQQSHTFHLSNTHTPYTHARTHVHPFWHGNRPLGVRGCRVYRLFLLCRRRLYGARFSTDIYTRRCHRSHACLFEEANMHVTNGIPLDLTGWYCKLRPNTEGVAVKSGKDTSPTQPWPCGLQYASLVVFRSCVCRLAITWICSTLLLLLTCKALRIQPGHPCTWIGISTVNVLHGH